MSSIPVAVYARYSSSNQDPKSIPDQFRKCEEFAKTHGMEVVVRYADEAMSGRSLDRPQFQEMLREARKGQRCAFRAVLVDEPSRLGRDLGITWRTIFEDLAAANIPLWDCSNGRSSMDPDARAMFGIQGLFADLYLDTLRKQTRRGLEGNAIEGRHTGGACFGYESMEDQARGGKVLRVSEQQAELVRRIFREYAAGKSLGRIANALNQELVRGPQDGSAKKNARGWSRSLLHFMLRNRRYLGEVTWGKREWFKDPVTRRRRYRNVPQEKWYVGRDEALRIIDDELWATVQSRHRTQSTPARPARDGGYYEHLMSGLLRCGSCGGPMSIVGRKAERGLSWASFGCSTNRSRGSSVCPNRKTVSERMVNETVLQVAMEGVRSPRFQEWVQSEMERTIRDRARSQSGTDARARLLHDIKAQEAQVERVGTKHIESPSSDFLKARLAAEEEKLRALRSELAKVAVPTSTAAVPTVRVEEVLDVLQRVEELAASTAGLGRDALVTVLEPVVLNPRPDGYQVEVRFQNKTAALAGGRTLLSDGCGGALSDVGETTTRLHVPRTGQRYR